MSINVWGIHPQTKKADIYALRLPSSEKDELIKRAEADGWTKVTAGPPEQWDSSENSESQDEKNDS